MTVDKRELLKKLNELLDEAQAEEELLPDGDASRFWYWQGFKDAVNSIGEYYDGPEWHKE